MKKYFAFAVVVSLFTINVKAQVPDTVRTIPSFPGGINKFARFIQKNLRMTDKGKMIISFVIEPDGNITNIKVLKSVSIRADSSAIQMMQKSPKWIPGTQNGRPVRVTYSLPLTLSSDF